MIDRAVEILRDNPELKYFEALEIARREYIEQYHSKINSLRDSTKQ